MMCCGNRGAINSPYCISSLSAAWIWRIDADLWISEECLFFFKQINQFLSHRDLEVTSLSIHRNIKVELRSSGEATNARGAASQQYLKPQPYQMTVWACCHQPSGQNRKRGMVTAGLPHGTVLPPTGQSCYQHSRQRFNCAGKIENSLLPFLFFSFLLISFLYVFVCCLLSQLFIFCLIAFFLVAVHVRTLFMLLLETPTQSATTVQMLTFLKKQ